jgi:hypothetical protein
MGTSAPTAKPSNRRKPAALAGADSPVGAEEPTSELVTWARESWRAWADNRACVSVFADDQREELHKQLRKAQPEAGEREKVIGRLGALCNEMKSLCGLYHQRASPREKQASMVRLDAALSKVAQALGELDAETRVSLACELTLLADGQHSFGKLRAELEALSSAVAQHRSRTPVKAGRRPSVVEDAQFGLMVCAELRDAGVPIVATEPSPCVEILRICLERVGLQRTDPFSVIRFLKTLASA